MNNVQELCDNQEKRIQYLKEKISKEDFNTWFASPCTKLLCLFLEKEEAEIMLAWRDGVYSFETVDGTKQANAKALGECQGYANTQVLIHELIEIEEEETDESDTTGTSGNSKA